MSAVLHKPSREAVLAWLGEVMDPEIPVVSVVDLGIVRDVQWDAADELVVTVTPTYSGCPATEVIAAAIREALLARGIDNMRLQTQLAPAWTTDWLSAAGREALRAYGIAPPGVAGGQLAVIDTSALARSAPVGCPLCGSANTRMLSRFGSTPCKALYRCGDCREPFDHFKPH